MSHKLGFCNLFTIIIEGKEPIHDHVYMLITYNACNSVLGFGSIRVFRKRFVWSIAVTLLSTHALRNPQQF